MALASSQSNTTPAGRTRRRVLLLVVSMLLGLSAALVSSAAPADAAGLPHRTRTEIYIAIAVERTLNQERVAHRLPVLHMNLLLIHSARVHDVTMARYNTMSHRLPGEASFDRRISAAGYHWTWCGENIAWNSRMTTSGVIALQKIMYGERAPHDGHRRNILSRHYRHVGIDVYMDRRHHKVWLTTDFATP